MTLYIRKPKDPEIVDAERVGPLGNRHPQGTRPARPGEWVITDLQTGAESILSNEEFVALYDEYAPAEEPA